VLVLGKRRDNLLLLSEPLETDVNKNVLGMLHAQDRQNAHVLLENIEKQPKLLGGCDTENLYHQYTFGKDLRWYRPINSSILKRPLPYKCKTLAQVIGA